MALPLISRDKVVELFRKLNLKTHYDFGGKWSLKATWDTLVGSGIDCSGFVRWLIYQASGGKVILVDGSQMQWDQVANKFRWRKLASYKDLQYAREDETRLFICFIKPVYIGSKMIKAGHVWLCTSMSGEMRTIESWGGQGVSSRKFNTAVFLLRGAVAYEIPVEENKE